jgi:hypothetical protein
MMLQVPGMPDLAKKVEKSPVCCHTKSLNPWKRVIRIMPKSLFTRISTTSLIGCCLFLTHPACVVGDEERAPVNLEGFEFPGSIRIGDEQVMRRGSGVLTWYGFKIYAAAYYSVSDKKVDFAFEENRPCQLSIRYFRKMKKKDLICVADECLDNRTDLDMDALRERINNLNNWYVDVKKGDEYRLIYRPGEGTALNLNGRELGVIPGVDFASAYFGVWLSKYSPNQELRNQLLDRTDAEHSDNSPDNP